MGGSGSGLSHAAGSVTLAVVALPPEDDVVRQYSSEKEPHLTLLMLGENKFDSAELANITGYIEHAASQLTTFWLDVDRRGELGEKKADVLFFRKRWMKTLENFRGNLLQNELINRAYLSVEQFPEWIPHLTMGFPETPAKKDTRDYPGFSSVRFDRIALWTGDSTGPIFQLKTSNDMEVAMSQQGANIAAAILAKTNDEDLVQFGVKGMKWGKRKTSGPGSGRPASADAARAAEAHQIVKKSGVQALSNKDLQDLVTRLNLEQQLGRLQPQTRTKKTKKFVAEVLLGVGKQQTTRVANDVAAKQVASLLARAK